MNYQSDTSKEISPRLSAGGQKPADSSPQASCGASSASFGDIMPQRAKDWLEQAKKDLEQAKSSRESEHHEWACFISQQSSEKAIKALHLSNGQQAWGHTVAKLIKELPVDVQPEQEIIEKAKVLDSFYVPTRYPNGHPEGAPFEHFGPLQSEEAIKYAGEIVEFVSDKMAQ